MSVKIVVVEDEEDILELIEYNLTKEGYEVIGFLNTKSVAQMLIEESIDLLIMDRNLPGVEGSEFVQALRKEGFVTPVIYLSAKSQDFEIEEGFLRGADDYITKPFNMKELLLRIKALLRRTSKKVEEGVLAYRDLLLDKSSRTLSVDGENVDVTKLEFNLLSEFILNKNSVLDRDYLLENVWDGAEEYQYKTVNVAINRLKEKIDPTKSKNYIQTVRGVGYKLC
ncbi:MAG: DNA-binding response regulator [Sulfurimonas sp. RIFCSPHIGHO2_12_FULL_36_9]|jgi:DNA-binding response OmpR family regulator|uniref:response regulator transcription factor n=1 Tax=unclassified Sulfurimonas TaxID=2623549 RepID=UPI0008D79868|nr:MULTISPECIES: response regulator transcription factor [unclassified Sulfurimonas]OHD98642.1 MAG: DNA-binding response regulator [Sulfurimonas sp. RIFCSPHIGHO2_12_FULL_36_9]OHD99135.1 MAG: DNA-binding response regulator [Sulfurimonas sp. RIFCSPLOWO2_02_FULL_36_28]OHE00423.1 MAG: DNA-binding response regulator [Sulfurimonas sp. RIFCSPLOWO2_12_36_12]OHE05283.1 MAG: DNA-binding response regulator [Sulfurimonas sp. RIFCSPLOWO2_12_FULL_36_74]